MTGKSARYNSASSSRRPRGRGGFNAMSGLIQHQIRRAGEKRGFAVMRLLTHWDEIVGADIAAMARPLDVGYAKGGFGATLTIFCSGANAPILQQMLPQIRERVNGCYGYCAISRVRITQTAPDGFRENQRGFASAPPADQSAKLSPEVATLCAELAQDVENDHLRQALETLGQNVMARRENTKKEPFA